MSNTDTACQLFRMILRCVEPTLTELGLISPEFIPAYCTRRDWLRRYPVLS